MAFRKRLNNATRIPLLRINDLGTKQLLFETTIESEKVFSLVLSEIIDLRFSIEVKQLIPSNESRH